MNASIKIADFIRKSNEFSFSYSSDNNQNVFELSLLYYEGYQVKLNNEIITFVESPKGFIQIETNTKSGTIVISYIGTRVQKISSAISLLTIFALVLYFTYCYQINRRQSVVISV